MTCTRRDRWLIPLGYAVGGALGIGIVRYIVHGGLLWGDAGFIAWAFITSYAAAFALDRLIYGPAKPST